MFSYDGNAYINLDLLLGKPDNKNRVLFFFMQKDSVFYPTNGLWDKFIYEIISRYQYWELKSKDDFIYRILLY